MWDSFPVATGAALARYDEIVRMAIDANGGEVQVSDLTAGLVEQVADVRLVDPGSIGLKGLWERMTGIEPAYSAWEAEHG